MSEHQLAVMALVRFVAGAWAFCMGCWLVYVSKTSRGEWLSGVLVFIGLALMVIGQR